MYVVSHLHIIIFIPVAVFAFTALLATAISGYADWRAGHAKALAPRAETTRPVLVHDRTRPVLIRTRRGNTTRTGVAVRMIYNGG